MHQQQRYQNYDITHTKTLLDDNSITTAEKLIGLRNVELAISNSSLRQSYGGLHSYSESLYCCYANEDTSKLTNNRRRQFL
jgi:hypothetical protein